MPDKKYIALLRGINVGGNNIIRMTELKESFETAGFTGVRTYIQSGNVIFETAENAIETLTRRIEQMLSDRFAYSSRIVLLSDSHLERIVSKAPEGFGSQPELFRYDVLFLMPAFPAEEAMSKIRPKEGVDRVWAGDRVLYFSRLIAKTSQSHLTKLVGTALYKELTIRNWNTTTKLHLLTKPGS